MGYTIPAAYPILTFITPAIWETDIVDNIIYLKSAISAQFVLTSGMWMSVTDGATPPTTTEMSGNKNNIFGIEFPKDVKKFAECAFPMPSDYAGGTITAKFYWCANSPSTDAVTWGIAAVAFGDGEDRDAAFGTAKEVSDANSGAYHCQISAATAAVTIAGTPVAGELVNWRVYRDGADALAVSALLEAVVITYTRT